MNFLARIFRQIFEKKRKNSINNDVDDSICGQENLNDGIKFTNSPSSESHLSSESNSKTFHANETSTNISITCFKKNLFQSENIDVVRRVENNTFRDECKRTPCSGQSSLIYEESHLNVNLPSDTKSNSNLSCYDERNRKKKILRENDMWSSKETFQGIPRELSFALNESYDTSKNDLNILREKLNSIPIDNIIQSHEIPKSEIPRLSIEGGQSIKLFKLSCIEEEEELEDKFNKENKVLSVESIFCKF